VHCTRCCVVGARRLTGAQLQGLFASLYPLLFVKPYRKFQKCFFKMVNFLLYSDALLKTCIEGVRFYISVMLVLLHSFQMSVLQVHQLCGLEYSDSLYLYKECLQLKGAGPLFAS
jgi:hypothetical protein